MEFSLSEDQQFLRRTVRSFAEKEIGPHVMEWDEAQRFPSELIPKLAALDLLGIEVPEHYGGAGMSAINYCICIEEIARVCPGVALSVAAHNGLCVSHLTSSDVRRRGRIIRSEERRVGKECRSR